MNHPLIGEPGKFNYHLTPPNSGKLFFRIRQTEQSGRFLYSAVRSVNMNDQAAVFTIYPNPAARNIAMKFDKNISGTFRIELTDQVGQVIYARTMKLNDMNIISFDIENSQPPGNLLFTGNERRNNASYSGKLLIR